MRGIDMVLEGAGELLAVMEARKSKKGLRHPRHVKHIKPARAAATEVLQGYFKRQLAALLLEVGPKINPLLGIRRESRTVNGKRFATTLLPESIVPLRYSVTAEEKGAWEAAMTSAITGAAAVLAAEMKVEAELPATAASNYLRDNSLTKLTGDFSAESVQQLRNAVADAWDAGGSYDQVVAAIKGTFEKFNDVRAGMIAQTEINDGYNWGRRATAVEAGFTEKAWDPDGEACAEICQPNVDQGWIPIDDDFQSGDPEPTAHPNCFLGDTAVLARNVSHAIRRRYEGEIRILRFAGLPDLSVTPNHPVLTRAGFIAAGQLKAGDHVAQCMGPSYPASTVNPDHQYVESSIEQIFDALRVSGGMVAARVPLSAEAFHGDFRPDSEVDIVWSARAVRDYFDSFHLSQERSFRIGEGWRVGLDTESAPTEILHTAGGTADSIMGSGRSGRAPFGWHAGVENKLSGAAGALLQPQPAPVIDNGNPRNSDPIRKCEHTFSGQVVFVELLEIEVSYFAGHVFNLTTDSGLYLANTIVVHNCDCGISFRKGGED